MERVEVSGRVVRRIVRQLWELSLLRPAVVVVRVLLTLGLAIAELEFLLALLRSDNWMEALAVGVAMLVALVLYFILMLIPDLWAILLSWEASVARGVPPRGWYRGLFLASDLGRLAAVSVVVAAGFEVMKTFFPALLAVHGGGLPGWWKTWLTLALLAFIGYAVWRITRAVRGLEEVRFPSVWVVAAFLAVTALELVIEGNVPVGAVGVVVLLSAVAVAGTLSWRSVERNDLQRAIAAGSVAVLLGVPALLRLGDLRNLPAGVQAICAPWWDVFVAPGLQGLTLAMAGGLAFGGAGGMAYILVMVILAGLTAFGVWVRSDVLRTLVRVGEGLAGERHRRVRRPELMLLRLGSLIVLVAGLCWVAFLAQGHAWAFQAFPGGLGNLLGSASTQLAVVLLWSLGLLGLVDVFQMAEDAAGATSGGTKNSVLDFKWLRALVGLMTAALWLGGAIVVLAWFGVLIKGGGRWGAAGVIVAVPVALGFLVLSVLPRLIGNLLRIEANTRPEGRSRVAVAPGFPGISAYHAWGRFMAWLAVFAALVLTGLGALALSFWRQVDAWGIVGIVIAGLLVALVIAILLGSIPDFLSLLLTLERNLREGSARAPLPGPEVSGIAEGPDEISGGRATVPVHLEEALIAVGDQLVAPPVVPPGKGGGVLVGQGTRGRYRVLRRGAELVLEGPDGAELGHFSDDGFVPRRGRSLGTLKDEEDIREDGIYRTPALPMSEISATGPPRPDLTAKAEEATSSGEEYRDTTTREPTVPFGEVVLNGLAKEQAPVFETTDVPAPILVPETPAPRPDVAPEPKPPLIDVERTPRAGEGSLPLSGAPVPPRPAARHEMAAPHEMPGHEALVSIPILGGTEGARVLAALTEILLVRTVLRSLVQGSLTSRLTPSGVELVAPVLDPAREARLRATLQAELEQTSDFAASLMETNVFEIKRFSKDGALIRREGKGRILAPGWAGGPVPPLGGVVVARRNGKALYRGWTGRRYPVKFAVLQRDALVVYGVRM